ncbi:MAG: flavodoxin family protein [Treponema sp.]|nr:flavodoxin family protein [Treponema sp.]MCL2252488.1 flavodoxin family protein [Treponema sp.]
MNILLLNGSPKGDCSNTLKIAHAFMEGLNANADKHIHIINISRSHIEPCNGCYSCWAITPGKCIINDDMTTDFLHQYKNADIIIWSFPLYFYGMPSKIKGFLDRLVPLTLPEIKITASGRNRHPHRYDLLHQRHVLISTCGFSKIENNYDALFKQFDSIFGKDSVCDRLTKIICPEGELFSIPQMSAKTDEYLANVTQAGKEFIQTGSFSDATQKKLNTLLFPAESFIEMANTHWEAVIAGAQQAGTESHCKH